MPWSIGVAHQVRQRIGDLLDDGLVELGVFAADDQLDVLAELAADVVHHALEAVEGRADLHHAQLQRAVAHALRPGAQCRHGFVQLGQPCALADESDGAAGDDQLADQVDQLVELVGIDANGLALLHLAFARLTLALEAGVDDVLLHRPLLHQDLAERLQLAAGSRALAGPAQRPGRARVNVPQRTRISPSRRSSSGSARIRSM